VAELASELQIQMNSVPNDEAIPVIIRHKAGFFPQRTGLLAATEIEYEFSLFPGEAVKIPPADIEALSQREDIEKIWLDLPVQAWLNDSVPKIQAPRVWDIGLKGQGVKVAVIDTGIDTAHPDFSGRIVTSKSFVSSSAHDDNGHGTHVAGIVAGSGAKSNGKYVGVAPEASLYIAKVLRADGGGSMSGVMAGIEWAVLEQNVQVINLSLGGTGSCDGTDALSVMCDEAVSQAGVVICVAAGNTGPDPRTVGSPGCARLVITIGASDDNDGIALFSSRGPTADGRIKPDIVYPGVGIIAAQAAGTQLGRVIAEGYVSLDGTSMATPHASGVAALMLQAKPELTAQELKTQMLAAAVKLGFDPNTQGVGRGDAYQSYLRAIGEVQPPPKPEPPKPEPPPPPTPRPEPRGCLASISGLFGRRS
jgi:serine protease AprX